MKIRCIDVETTGVPSDTERGHRLVEVGWTDLTDGEMKIGEEGRYFNSELVDPGIPIPVIARAVHHISDDDVEGCINPTEACVMLADGDHEYICAHNIDFEKQFVGAGDRKWICTYKTALRIWPDAPGHKLAELMYFLELDKEPGFDKAIVPYLHRAGPDSYVCALLLRKILSMQGVGYKDFADLLKWSSGPALVHMCFMKKHKGKPWSQVVVDDPDYMICIPGSDVNAKDIRATVRYWLRIKGHITEASKPAPGGM